MRSPHLIIAAATAALFFGLEATVLAQTAPTESIAPGADLPSVGFGGIGPANVPIAPGPAMNGTDIERIGPGGGLIAPGPAGSVSGSMPLTTPVLPSAPAPGRLRMR